MYATQGASTSRLPTDSGITLYKGLDAAPHEANFADFPDPPPIVASMIGQQLATVPDLIRQAQVMTHVHWGSPSQHTSSITPTMPISDPSATTSVDFDRTNTVGCVGYSDAGLSACRSATNAHLSSQMPSQI